jgi:hypothetical protein
MATQTDLFLAILALDAYNRDSNPGMNLPDNAPTSQTGDATNADHHAAILRFFNPCNAISVFDLNSGTIRSGRISIFFSEKCTSNNSELRVVVSSRRGLDPSRYSLRRATNAPNRDSVPGAGFHS